ncbi:diguanylate cyclase [Pseudobutyrivibrio sp.]|uniref:diguanylate cyclase n=1 Tax=Pseudobutyrivibrio sp. TaxID=2014367 RepID=UPI001D82D2E0|nr:diguanylate cyclase [Pseudobutyrivibrio sp.]MBE5910811.1 diguanylate cyclase [Pseudobutyrivibrio sp.]
MIYSVVSAFALIVNLILNWEFFKEAKLSEKNKGKKEIVSIRYGQFLMAVNGYFVVDILWGILYQYHEVPALFPILYSDTVFYFIFMLMTMLTWVRYIVAYLDRSGRLSKLLIYSVWIMFILGLIYLMINHYHRFIFDFTRNHEYIAESGRYITYILQSIFYFVTSMYMFHIAYKSIGQKKVRYMAVATTSIIMGVFLVLQTLLVIFPLYAIGLMIGICVVHSFGDAGVKRERAVHDNIAATMAEDYEVIYYIFIETGEYLEFAKSQKYMSMNVPTRGKDFFKETMHNLDDYVYEDDKEYARSFYNKETLLEALEGKRSFSFKYRLVIDGEPRYFLFTAMRTGDGQYFIIFIKDIEDELQAEKLNRENQQKTVTFTQIAESLASNYDVIYYVNIEDSSYVSYGVDNVFGQLELSESGDNFFEECYENIPKVIHKQDRDMLLEFINRDNMISALEISKGDTIDYRTLENNKPHYTRMKVRKTSDGTHFIIAIENIDDEVKREKLHQKELNNEKEQARRDELTGIKNKKAYKELEESVQANLDSGMDYLPFGLVVSDANNLKKINDTLGHAAGDEYIKASAKLLCDTYVHSPVFRIGGDEFVVFIRGNDFKARHELLNKLRSQVIENQKSGNGPVLACGMAEYEPERDTLVSQIFERADGEMYKNKKYLKEEVK